MNVSRLSTAKTLVLLTSVTWGYGRSVAHTVWAVWTGKYVSSRYYHMDDLQLQQGEDVIGNFAISNVEEIAQNSQCYFNEIDEKDVPSQCFSFFSAASAFFTKSCNGSNEILVPFKFCVFLSNVSRKISASCSNTRSISLNGVFSICTLVNDLRDEEATYSLLTACTIAPAAPWSNLSRLAISSLSSSKP